MKRITSEFIDSAEISAENEARFGNIFNVYLSAGAITEAEASSFRRVLEHDVLKNHRQQIILSLLLDGEPSVFVMIRSARDIVGKTLYEIYFAKLKSYLREIRAKAQRLQEEYATVQEECPVDPEMREKIMKRLREVSAD